MADSQIALPLSGNDLPATLTLGVRAEDVTPGQGDQRGEIALIEPLGVETILHIRSGDVTLLSLVSGMTHHRLGGTMPFGIDRERLHFFDAKGDRIGVKREE